MLFCANSNQPWSSTIPTLVLLPKCRTPTDVNQIHARLITTGFIKNTSLTAKLILSFCSSPHQPLVEFARHVFLAEYASQNRKTRSDPLLWNAIIKSFSHGDDPKQAVVLFSLMLERGICVDKFSFSLALKACSRMGSIEEGMQIHGLLRKFKIGLDLFLQNCLICLYLRCGCLEFARQLFDRMAVRDSVSFNSMIDGHLKCGMVNLARELFDSMPVEMKNLISWNSMISGHAQSEDGFNVAWELFEQMPEKDLVSWNLMIRACVKHRKIEVARALFSQMPEKDVVSWATVLDGYAKFGSIDIARALFNEMPERDVISYNAMIGGYVQNGRCMEALMLIHDILSGSKLRPDGTTLLLALSAVAQLGRIDEGILIHCYIEENGFALGGKLGVALIHMYSKCGSIENALLVFEDIVGKSVDHWNAMIGGLAVNGLGELAFELFMEMERLSLKPDDITFIGVLNACSHAGLVKEGLLCFDLMRRVHKMEPKLQHYGCMVDILGRGGYIKAARNFIEEMPIEPNDVIWRSLLSACRIYENFDIGELVAKHLIGLDSGNSSSYVLLANIYAGFGMWESVRRVRMMMKERNLKKIPGCSWVELEGIIHEFFAGDETHPQAGEIYSPLGRGYTINLEVTSCLHRN